MLGQSTASFAEPTRGHFSCQNGILRKLSFAATCFVVGHPETITLTCCRQVVRVRKQTLRLNADAVVHRSADPLFTTEVPLCGLNRHVSEKELDLLQFATAGVTELRA